MPPTVLGLLAAAAAGLYFCPVPPARPFNFERLCTLSVGYLALVAFAAAAPSLWPLYRRRLPLAAVLRTVVAGTWFAPFWVLFRQGSEMAVLCGAVLCGFVAWRFLSDESEPRAARFLASFSMAALLQAGVLAWAVNWRWLAILLLGAVAAFLVRRFAPPVGIHSRTLHRAPALLGLVLLLLFRGMLPYGQFGGGGSAGVPRGASEPAPGATVRAPNPGDGIDAAIEAHSGVILWPEAKPIITLVPPLPALQANPFSKQHSEPLAIPFFGVYWFFRPPHASPPKNSHTARGDPARTTFRSTDRRPLRVEAHQHLAQHIDLACCRGFRVDIRNGDRFPGTVDMELILADTAAPAARELSLGRQPVLSTLPFRVRDDGSTASERLEFALPAKAVLRRFDAFGVRFHLSGWRTRVSCRIAIERFVLLPR